MTDPLRRQLTRWPLRNPRRAVTLVELIVVVLVIALLASIVMYSLAGIQNNAIEARTRTQIAKLHDLIALRWDDYARRRPPVQLTGDRSQRNKQRADALREMMRFEFPERISDLGEYSGSTFSLHSPEKLDAHPSLALRYKAMIDASGKEWSISHQGAECLYMIIANMREGQSPGLSLFRQSEIADVDNDGMPEFVDGWGNTVLFLRWAPGFNSPLQEKDPNDNPDPFDPHGVYNGYGLFPLIVSAGPDGRMGVALRPASSTLSYKDTTPPNDPYTSGGSTPLMGSVEDADAAADNIHNHRLATSIR